VVPPIGAPGLGNEISVIGNEDSVATSYRLFCFILVLVSYIFVRGPYDFISSVRSWVACSGICVKCPVDDVRRSWIYAPAGNNYPRPTDN